MSIDFTRDGWRAGSVWLSALTLAGCASLDPPSGAHIRAQALANVRAPDHWQTAGAASGTVAHGWLRDFPDPTLAAYIKEALSNNADLQSAAMRVEQARYYVIAAGAALYPAVNAVGRAGASDTNPDAGWKGAALTASWELDLWGRVRADRASASASYAASTWDYAYARESLAATIAKAWLTAIETRLQLQVATDAVRTAEQLVDISLERRRVGAGNEYDIANAKANLGRLHDTERQLQLADQQARRALEILLGRYPAAQLAVTSELPPIPPPVPVGLPSELLERRPDVVAAERRIAAAFFGAQSAKAARLPKISLTAGVSSISSDLFFLKDRDNPVWGAGASLLAPIYDGGALKAQQDIKTTEQAQAVADYARVGLRAFNEVESALANEFSLKEREVVLREVVTNNERALSLAQTRYRLGAIDLREVSQQQLSLYSASTALLRVQGEARLQRINLYLALGGSFEMPALEPAADTTRVGSLR